MSPLVATPIKVASYLSSGRMSQPPYFGTVLSFTDNFLVHKTTNCLYLMMARSTYQEFPAKDPLFIANPQVEAVTTNHCNIYSSTVKVTSSRPIIYVKQCLAWLVHVG